MSDDAPKKDDGTLKYIHGIPYISGPNIYIPPKPTRRQRLLAFFSRFPGNVLLFLLLMVFVGAAAYLIEIMLGVV